MLLLKCLGINIKAYLKAFSNIPVLNMLKPALFKSQHHEKYI